MSFGWIVVALCVLLLALGAWYRRRVNNGDVMAQLKVHRANAAIDNPAYAISSGSSELRCLDEVMNARPENGGISRVLSNAVYAPAQDSDSALYAVPMDVSGAPQTVVVAAPPTKTFQTYAIPMEGATGDTVTLAAYDTVDTGTAAYSGSASGYAAVGSGSAYAGAAQYALVNDYNHIDVVGDDAAYMDADDTSTDTDVHMRPGQRHPGSYEIFNADSTLDMNSTAEAGTITESSM